MKTPLLRARGAFARSIPARLALFALALAVPILVFVGLILWQFASSERARLESDALDTARGISVALDRELTGYLATSEALALSPSLQAGDVQAFHDQAVELQVRRGLTVVLRRPDGQQLVNTRRPFGEDLPRTPIEGADTIALDQRRAAVSGLFIGTVAAQPLFSIVTPVIRKGSGEVTYLLALSLSVDRLQRVILDEKPAENAVVSLVDRTGRIMARNVRQDEFVGRTATADLLANTTGPAGTWKGTTIDGRVIFGAYARIKTSDWRVAVGVSQADLRAPLVASLSWFALTGAALAMLASLLALVMGRRIVAPMRLLSDQAAALGRGETVAAQAHSLREVETVSRALADASSRLAIRAAERDRALEALKDETQRLDLLNRVGAALSAELDLGRLARTAIDAATRLTGAAYGALFERVAGRDGAADVWRLVSLAGAEEAAFTRFGLPRPTTLFSPTFAGSGIVRSDDVGADPRYGSMGGMPAGHLPVRSYLAVPVVSRAGETMGAFLFGHPAPARFGDREEHLVTGLAGQTATAMDNARLFRSVQREQERFGAAVRAVHGVVWTNDASGRMSGEQAGWAAMTGQSRAEYAGYGWADAVHPEDAAASLESWNRAVAERRPYEFEHRIRRHDGIWRTFAVKAIPILEEDGAIREWVGVHTDITQQREAEAELKESNEEVQRYAYIVSHDLRAPLVNIMGFTSEIETARGDVRAALGEHPDAARIDGELAEAVSFIKAATSKMDGLINAILKLSREGRRTFAAVPLPMTELVQGLADAQRHQAESSGAAVEIAPLPEITADRLAVEQIFGNLLDNALKYLDRTRPGHIRVSGTVSGPWVRFEVADNGRGIARQDHARVFELFRRSGVQDRPGEGIGLAHVRTLARVLGGRIDLTSEPGVGTVFAVTLPRRPPRGHQAARE